MSVYVSPTTRQTVAQRADFRCEYCRVQAEFAYFPFHIEHIISLKHGGLTHLDNLAYACQICNLSKGSDIATFLNDMEDIVRFFNPRKDIWQEHFEVDKSGWITSLTDIAAATIKILDLNHPDSIIERRELLKRGLF